MNLTPHFTLEEMTFSEAAARFGLSNAPGERELTNLRRIAGTMESIRVLLGFNPILVHSGYRSIPVNALVGGVPSSAHVKGLACDFVCPGFGSNYALAKKIEGSAILYDQVILEYGWVHLGLAEIDPMRHESLTKRSAAAPYEAGINV